MNNYFNMHSYITYASTPVHGTFKNAIFHLSSHNLLFTFSYLAFISNFTFTHLTHTTIISFISHL